MTACIIQYALILRQWQLENFVQQAVVGARPGIIPVREAT